MLLTFGKRIRRKRTNRKIQPKYGTASMLEDIEITEDDFDANGREKQ